MLIKLFPYFLYIFGHIYVKKHTCKNISRNKAQNWFCKHHSSVVHTTRLLQFLVLVSVILLFNMQTVQYLMYWFLFQEFRFDSRRNNRKIIHQWFVDCHAITLPFRSLCMLLHQLLPLSLSVATFWYLFLTIAKSTDEDGICSHQGSWAILFFNMKHLKLTSQK